jgi:hypothetical protein
MNQLILFLTTALLFSCQKDQDEPKVSDQVLHYDGPNQSAPVLARGISYPLVKFPGSEIQQAGLTGESLSQIDYYVNQRPSAAKLLIFGWNQSTDTEPGDLLYEATLGQISNNSWNTVKLDRKIALPDKGVWIAFEINAGDNDIRVIGCDTGPRHPDGDGYGVFGNNNEPGWTDFYNFSNQDVNINWNIRAVTE